MILVLHNNQCYTPILLQYLDKKSISYSSIAVQDLIDYGKIIDYTYSSPLSCVWVFKDQVIDFSKLSGIYNMWQGLEVSYLDNYVIEDQEYVRSEWAAYLTFCLNNTTNCINKPSKERQCGLIDQVPFLFKKAKQIGFKVPNYTFSTLKKVTDEFNKKYNSISLKDLYLSFEYKKSYQNQDIQIGACQYIEGQETLVYIVGDKIFSWEKDNDLTFKIVALPTKIVDMVVSFARSLELTVAEFRLIKTKDNNYIFYWFSAIPIWTAYHLPEIEIVFDHLTYLLLSS